MSDIATGLKLSCVMAESLVLSRLCLSPDKRPVVCFLKESLNNLFDGGEIINLNSLLVTPG